jgi:superoxide reductase
MQDRRNFLKGSLVVAGVAVASGIGRGQGAVLPPGIVYSKESPGRWAGRENSHVPKATLEGKNIKVVNSHGMSEKHYIVKHTVLMTDGKLIGEKTFAPTDPAAESSFTIPDGFKGTLWVTSFCNIHDLWLTEFTV